MTEYEERELELEIVKIEEAKTAHQLLMEAYARLNQQLDVVIAKRKKRSESSE